MYWHLFPFAIQPIKFLFVHFKLLLSFRPLKVLVFKFLPEFARFPVNFDGLLNSSSSRGYSPALMENKFFIIDLGLIAHKKIELFRFINILFRFGNHSIIYKCKDQNKNGTKPNHCDTPTNIMYKGRALHKILQPCFKRECISIALTNTLI